MQLDDIKKQKISKRKNFSNERKNKTAVDRLLDVLLLLFCIGLVVIVSILLNYKKDIREAENTFTKIHPVETEDAGTEKPLIFVQYNDKYVWEKYLDAYMQNQDFIGWITIEDTVIDYPVMQSIGDNEYYLHRDFNKNYSTIGTIFADEKSDIATLSDNVILYGHHIKAGRMFASLEQYDDEEFAEKHKVISFDTLDGHNEYEVIGAFRTSVNHDSFKYYLFFKDSEDFTYEDYIKEVKERSYLQMPNLHEKEQLLTLSTCDYHEENGRFVVVCRKISDTNNKERKYMTYEEYLANKE